MFTSTFSKNNNNTALNNNNDFEFDFSLCHEWPYICCRY